MSFGEDSAQTWIERGKQAYWQMQLPEAAADFEKAVAADSRSVEARLCYGVACLFLYLNGVGEAQPALLGPAPPRQWSEGEFNAAVQRTQSLIATQNATNGAHAEENLRRAIELDPGNELAMDYLADLYYRWADPDTDSPGNKRGSRRHEALRVYEQILDFYPQHKFAHYVCGVIHYEKAFELMRSAGYPRPIVSDEARRTLSIEVSPVLDDANRNLLRALEIDPGNWRPVSYLMLVKQAQVYVAETKDEQSRASVEAAEWTRKTYQHLEAEAQVAGRSWPPRAGGTVTMTFHRLRPLK